jgi:hypothetical protein
MRFNFENKNKSSSRAHMDCFVRTLSLLAMTMFLLSPLHAETAPTLQPQPTHGISIFGDLCEPHCA